MSKNSFGNKFVVVNDIQQQMDPRFFTGGPWIHHATIVRGLDEYIAFRHANTNEMYIEKIERNRANFNLVKIEDDNEWNDIYYFLMTKGYLLVNPGEMKIGMEKN